MTAIQARNIDFSAKSFFECVQPELLDCFILLFPIPTRYYLATSADDSVVKLWDLRKLKNFKTITLEDRFEVCCKTDVNQLVFL